MFEIGAGGSLEKMAEWEQSAGANIRLSLLNEFAKREHLRVTDFDEGLIPTHLRPTYDETLLLYEKVWKAVLTHAFKWQHADPPTQALFFPAKARDFTYSLGQEVAGLAPQSDALLIIRGFDQRSSGGRKALGVVAGIIGGAGALPRRGGNMFTASLVDSNTGDILWFSHSLKPHDLRDVEEARQLAADFMIDLPMLGQTP